MPRGLAVTTDGEAYVFDATEESIHDVVGGWIEIAPQSDSELTFYCNEEGKLMNLPFNPRANRIISKTRPWTDPLMGNVVIVGGVDEEGNDTDLTDKQIARLIAL
jgi:hypothetical protein